VVLPKTGALVPGDSSAGALALAALGNDDRAGEGTKGGAPLLGLWVGEGAELVDAVAAVAEGGIVRSGAWATRGGGGGT